MGDHLWAGKPSRYVISTPRSTQPSILAWLELWWVLFSYVRWQ